MSLPAPVLWFNKQGIIAGARGDSIAANAAIEVAGRYAVLGAVGTTSVLGLYSLGGPWVRTALAAGHGAVPKLMYGAPNGDIFYSLQYDAAGADTGALWRVPVGSATPVKVLDVSGDSAWLQSMCADDDGNLYVNQYSTLGGGNDVVGLFKSTDSGATFTKIVSATGYPGSGLVPLTHIHKIVWDKYHKVLISSCGDGTGMYNQISADGGTTWTSWTATIQSTMIVPTKDYLFFAADLSTDTGIYRAAITGTGVAAVIAATATRVLNPVTDLGLATQAAFGIGWDGYVDSFGYLVMPRTSVSVSGVAALLMVSPDMGTTWRSFRSPAYAGSGTADFNRCPTNSDYPNKTGYNYGFVATGSSGPGLVEWRIVPSGWSPLIDTTAGTARRLGLGPWNEIPDYGWTPNINPSLNSNYNIAGYFSVPGCVINKRGKSFNGSVSTAPLFTQTCEALPVSGGWAQSIGSSPLVINAVDNTNFKTQAGSIKWTTAGLAGTSFGSWQKTTCFSTDVVAQPNCWVSAWWMADFTPTAVIQVCASIENGNDYVRAQVSTGNLWQLRIKNQATSRDDLHTSDLGYSPSQWYYLKIHVVRSATAGRVRFWVNNLLALDIEGINTVGTGNYTDGKFGFTTTQVGVLNIWIDQLNVSYADPDQPSGMTLDRTCSVIA